LNLTGKFAALCALWLIVILLITAVSGLSFSTVRYEIEQGVLANAEIQSVYARVDRIGRQTRLVMALLVCGGGLVSFLAAGGVKVSILRNIKRILDVAHAFQEGDLDARVLGTSADELGQLADTFNAMAAQIKAKVIEMASLNQDLQASERKYRKLFENSQDTIVTTTLEGVLLDVNPAGARLLGYTPSDLLGRDIRTLLVLPAQYEAFRERFLSVGAFSLETQMLRADGMAIDVLLNAALQRSDDGTPTGFQIILRDVTEVVKAEAALRLTQYSVEHSSNMIFWVDAEARLKYVNETACECLGYTREELLMRTLFDINLFWSPKVWETNWHWLKQTGANTLRSLYRRKDGSTFPVEVTANYLEFNQQEYLFAFAVDVTERQQADADRARLMAQVREQALQVQQILNTTPEGMLLLDGARRVVLANPSGEACLQLLADARVGDVLLRLGKIPLDEVLTATPEGLWHEISESSRIFRVVARVIETGPVTGGWVLAIHEVTQEHEIEQRIHRQERLAAVGQLAAGIAHDFNNIMAVIILYSQLAMRDPDAPPKLHERLKTITQQGQRASELIGQILDFSRSAVLDLSPLDVVPLFKEQVKLWQRTLPEDITVTLDYPTDQAALTVRADPTRLQQMLMNLVVNARDAMPEGGLLEIALARVTVTADMLPPLPEMHAGLWVRITVRDTGIGIPPEVLPHIFEPFYTTKAPGKGTGLGLAQVYGIVGQHEGVIDVTSSPGIGTTFTIYLPMLSASPNTSLAADSVSLPTGAGETVLVVEDDAVTRSALLETLRMLNYHPLEAADGVEALEIYRQHRADIALVLSDLVMPRMGGRALVQTLQEECPEVRVIILTGHPLDQEMSGIQLEGIKGWMQKPPNLEGLADLLTKALHA